MRVLSLINNGINFFLDIVYPRPCLFCKKILSFDYKDCVCLKCSDKLSFVDSYCDKCGKALLGNGKSCDDCRKQVHFFEKGRSLFVYESDVKNAIIDFKHRGNLYKARDFASLMQNFYFERLNWSIDLVIPVPMHVDDIVKRGYNQSEILAKYFAKLINIPCNTKILEKIKKTSSQQKLGREDRLKNLIYGFYSTKLEGVNKILLIDDVYTTGATIDACSKSLLDAGYLEVYFLTLATGERY